ncbi:MAG: hypothetical protein HQL15_00105 [Candidatus Omnitrophica bacterium]|nr:hypothetical protein [Candidatus Omnitrophota bacterium]
MPNDLWWVPLAAGLQDGINPCFLLTAALILLWLRWCQRVNINKLCLLLFLLSIILTKFIFNIGLLDRILLNNYFQPIAKCFYVLVAIVVGLNGLMFLKQWFGLLKGKDVKAGVFISRSFSFVDLLLGAILAGIVLGSFLPLWPVNYYILASSIHMMMPGQEIALGLMIVFYTVLSFWMVYVMIWVSSLESSNQRLFKMMAAAVLLSASLGVITLFL